jgi:multiple sugar transport system permease protein
MITVPCTILSVFICSLVGYGLGRYKFKGRNLVYACVLFSIILPFQVVQLPQVHYYRWFDIFGIGKLIGLFTGEEFTVNILNSLLRMYIPAALGVGLKAGIIIFLFQSFFAGMPRDLEEAAKIDGCSPFKIYWKVMIPNIVPVVVTVTLLSVIYYWNDSLVTDMSKLNVGNALMPSIESLVDLKIGAGYMTIMQRNVEYYSILIVAVTPLILVFSFGQKFFVECMDRSGSKG